MLRRLTALKIPHNNLRSMATVSELPRPPPRTQPEPVTFSSPSRPRAYYARQRDLPKVTRKWGSLIGLSAAGLAAWAAFLTYATNMERLSSSVVRKILVDIRANDAVHAALGDSVRPEPAWYMNGQPFIHGSANLLQGNVDISFRVKGSHGAGTLYFTSIRKHKGEMFTILRYKMIFDNGQVLELKANDMAH